jgi:hypothetical protein
MHTESRAPKFPELNEDSVEQWDYFQCRGCGPYMYRHRTRGLQAI